MTRDDELITLSECAAAMREIANALDGVIDGKGEPNDVKHALRSMRDALTEYLNNHPEPGPERLAS